MNAFSDIKESIGGELHRLNSHIRLALKSQNSLMDSIVDNYLSTKGKQIRPMLVILAAKLFARDGVISDKVINGAASVEMLHNATLIHDDVVDESKLRRSLPTINSIWDNHIAVLMGDFFVSSSLYQAVLTDDLRIVSVLASLGRMLSTGELDQIYNARFHCLTEDDYFKVISRKTASLFEACVKIGAYAVGIRDNDPRLDALVAYASALGLCFQIRDDIFDYFDDSRPGKPTGNDLREGKITLPLIHALSIDCPERDQMLSLARADRMTDDSIALLTDYAKRMGGIDYSHSVMQRLYSEAMTALDCMTDINDATPLRDLFSFIIARTF